MTTKIKGIDISHWQNDAGPIDWNKVKKDGVEFVIVKATEGTGYVDPYFKANVKNAKKVGLKVGAYHFARFETESKMKAELNHFLKTIKGMGLTYPAVLDLEDQSLNVSKSKLTDLAKQFLDGIEDAGYFAMLYTYTSYIDSKLDESKLKDYALWMARYSSKLGRDADIWQYSQTGKVNGIKGDVDLNWGYRSDLFGEKGKTVDKPKATTPKPAPKPKPKATPSTHTVKSGDTLSEIAVKYGTTTANLKSINGLKDADVIYIGQKIKLTGSAPTPKATTKNYTVKSGDTLSGIASKNGTTVAKLKSLNGIKDADVIFAGQKIKLPK